MKNRLLLLLFVCLSFAGAAQEALPLFNARLLRVKFPDDAGYRVSEGDLIVPAGRPALPESLKALGWWSRTSDVDVAKLLALRERAAHNLGHSVPDPTAAFHFHLYDPNSMDFAQAGLRRLEGVQQVRRVPVPRNAKAPDFTALQTYVFSTLSGINADSVHSQYRNRGTGIQICDIEYDFNHSHADLPQITTLGPVPISVYGTHHATAVLGELGALNDSAGTTGIASDSRLYFASAYFAVGQDTVYDIEQPVLAAAATLTPGDIILLEQQIAGPNYDTNGTSQKGLVAVEWYEPFYDAIELATGNGIIVVEAAGNGQQNFDAPEYSSGNDGHYPFDGSKSSGAIIVGAGSVGSAFGGSGQPRSRLSFSNFGNRVDVQGNGEQVTTTGYFDLYSLEGTNRAYTAVFSGTSSASPIVAGAAALLQSVYKIGNNGNVLSPAAIRNLLVSTGREQQSGAYGDKTTAHIGPLPNVYAAIRSLARLSVPEASDRLDASVFPNPAAGMATIRVNGIGGSGPVAVRIYNALGICVAQLQHQSPAAEIPIDVSALPAGVYQAQLRRGDVAGSAKFTVWR